MNKDSSLVIELIVSATVIGAYLTGAGVLLALLGSVNIEKQR